MADEDTVPGMAGAIAGRMAALDIGPVELEQRSKLSSPQCLDVRNGRRKGYQKKTHSGIARALKWPRDWYARLVAGEDPATFPTVEWPEERTIDERVADLEARVLALAEAVEQAVER